MIIYSNENIIIYSKIKMIKLLSIILATSFLSSLKLTSAIFLGKENGNATKPNAIAQVEKNHRVKISM